ncbi:hypothetical protein APHAL10511_007956 [Amanita phalloides]|nr:hypothetical protein APHAL10511_007956 [Amanita phalloides]
MSRTGALHLRASYITSVLGACGPEDLTHSIRLYGNLRFERLTVGDGGARSAFLVQKRSSVMALRNLLPSFFSLTSPSDWPPDNTLDSNLELHTINTPSMLIKLIPESPNPAVLFALTFANAPFVYSPDKPHASVPDDISMETSLFMSPGWVNQLNTLVIDDLDAPIALHALDRAAGIPTLLQEVTLDVPSNTIRCLFVDGSVEEWMWPANAQTPVPVAKRPHLSSSPVIIRSYLEKLQGIVKDVTQSAEEEERERQKELYLSQQQQNTETFIPTPRPVFKSHKKQRSFFMNLVASIVNLTPGSSSSHSHSRLPPPLSLIVTPFPKRSPSTVPLPPSPTPPQTPTYVKSPFPPLWSPPNTPIRQTLRTLEPPASASRTLRWRARSSLVDAFRRFILPEIISRFPYGSYRSYHAINISFCGPDGSGRVAAGYYVWTIESILRRAGERMDELVQLAAAAGAEMGRERDRRSRTKIFPRFSVPRRKFQGSIHQATVNIRRSVEEERERERRGAEYFASTTQSIQSPHLFSDEEEDATGDARPQSPVQWKGGNVNLVEDEEMDSTETDTDGSSLHTPSSGHENFVFPPPSDKPPPTPPKHTKGVFRIVPILAQPKPPPPALVPECPPPGSLPPIEMAEYMSLSRLAGKLQHLLIGARARATHAESEARQREALLEVRSRRRAWLNRALRSGAPSTVVKGQSIDEIRVIPYGYIATCTMSTPYMSSPLARSVWTAEDWEYVPTGAHMGDDNEVVFQERTRIFPCDNERLGFGYQLRRMGPGWGAKTRGEHRLFPVTEEEEDESLLEMGSRPGRGDEEALMGMGFGEDDVLRELELGVVGLGLDLEGGDMTWENETGECGNNANADPGAKATFDSERPKVRKRTSSMYEQQSPFGRPQNQKQSETTCSQAEQKTTPCDSSSALSASSLLCQPLTARELQDLKPQAVFMPPQADKAMIRESFIGEIKDSGEFTLSMDLPPPKGARGPPSAFGNLPSPPSVSIISPSPQTARQIQFTVVQDAQ